MRCLAMVTGESGFKAQAGPIIVSDYSGVCFIIIIIIIIQHLYSAIMSYADTEALVAPVKSE